MLTVQGYSSLRGFGTPELLGMFVSLAGVREVFPLIGAGCAGAKIGSAVASEIATMRLGQQLDALEVMGVDPVPHVYLPRMLACVIGTPLLVGVCILSGLVASYLIFNRKRGGVKRDEIINSENINAENETTNPNTTTNVNTTHAETATKAARS